MKKLFFFVAAALMSVAMTAEEKELKLYSTNFQDWDAISSSTTPASKKVTTRYSNEELTFTLAETQVDPNGTNAKFTSEVITTGYAMAAKTATPYIETSVLKNITKVHYVHAATGGSRGWGLMVKGDGDADWVEVQKEYCNQAGTAVDVPVNRTNAQLRWYNLNASQNAYMTELAIYGMAEDDGQAMEYMITYFDQNGNRLGDTIQTEEETLVFAFTEADLTIPEGYKFRGWYDAGMTRHNEGEAITGDLRLTALVTEIETAEVGKFYDYNLTKNTFYAEDHECFIPTNGAFYNNHGWKFQANGTIELPVAGNAYVQLYLCQYSDEADITVTAKHGNYSQSVPAKAETDGAMTEVFYDGEPDTLVVTFAQQAYIHRVSVYNVKGAVEKGEHGYYVIASGDAAALLMTLKQAKEGDKIFLPNGVYDLGELVLTEISKNNISIIGQSMVGTIIKNAPDAKTESINNTATLYILKDVSGTYLQDLTIQNALDYYKANNGRAVALWDKGTKTICKNVRLLSYQDTYYSNLSGAVKFFDDCEIHGTVDYICGDGSVYFRNNLLYCEKRSSNGGGSDAITANNGPATDKGYVFVDCTIKSECPVVSLGRAWNNTPSVAYINTLVDYSAGEFSFADGNGIQRWTKDLMNENAWPKFGEYNTRLADGTVLTPASNVVTFKDKAPSTATKDIETVLNEADAAVYTMAYTLGDWAAKAEEDAKQAVAEMEAKDFEPDGIYLVEAEGEFRAIIKGSEFMEKFARYDGVAYTVRKANARGGFGKKAGEQEEAIETVETQNVQRAEKFFRNGQLVIIRDGKAYNALGAQL